MTQDFSFFNSWNDPQQIRLLEDRLPTELTYEGEFGPEIVTFVPFIFNLYLRGILENRKVSTYSGMSPYYYFLKPRNLIETPKNRSFVPAEQRWWPNSNEHHRPQVEGEVFPKYRKRSLRLGRPTIFIQNKYCVEWGREPINFIDLCTLKKLFESTRDTHNVIYSRQGISIDERLLGISIDHNSELPFEDLDLCSQFSHVRILERIQLKTQYNRRKLRWINKSDFLVGVQGGSNYPWSYFSKEALVLHKEGRELDFSYVSGFYTYISNPALNIKIVNNYSDFLCKFNILKDC